MPRVIEETLVDQRVSVTHETKTKPNPDGGSDLEHAFTVLTFADRHAGDIRLVRIPLDDAGKQAVIQALTGGVLVPTADASKIIAP